MSLLMDALRKAEADKKQAANKPAAETADEVADNGIALDAATRELAIDDDIDLAETVAKASREEFLNSTGELSINVPAPEPAAIDELSLEPIDEPEPVGDATLVADSDGTLTTPTPRAVESQLGEYFDESRTDIESDPSNDPLAALTPDERYDTGVTESVASAHTVFEAGSSGPSRKAVGWSIAVAAMCVLMLAAAGIYYFQQAPGALDKVSPKVAVDVERDPIKELPVIPVDDPEPMPLPAVPESPVAESETSTEVLLSEPFEPAVGEMETAGTHVPEAVEAEPLVTLEIEPDPLPAPDALPVPATEAVPEIGVRPGEVRIARSVPPVERRDRLNDAYAAIVAGEFAAAESLYDAVLAESPNQVDALLGSAAVRLREGDVATAHQRYRQVLDLEPGNPTATAALFGIEGGQGDRVSESELKMMLDDGVDAGYIYFSLGNLYSRHERWSDAQQAYFEALRHHPNHPDYNYNLAVSLDRIGQRQAAAGYYEKAISLTESTPAGFDPAHALTRLSEINTSPLP